MFAICDLHMILTGLPDAALAEMEVVRSKPIAKTKKHPFFVASEAGAPVTRGGLR